jgi:hypothetical protein
MIHSRTRGELRTSSTACTSKPNHDTIVSNRELHEPILFIGGSR